MANLVGRPRKERDIVKLLYEENKEYSKVMAFVKNHMKENNGCKCFASKEIMNKYDLPIASMGNAICDYINYLQNKINNAPHKDI